MVFYGSVPDMFSSPSPWSASAPFGHRRNSLLNMLAEVIRKPACHRGLRWLFQPRRDTDGNEDALVT